MTPSLGEDTMDWLIEAQRKLNYHQLKLVVVKYQSQGLNHRL